MFCSGRSNVSGAVGFCRDVQTWTRTAAAAAAAAAEELRDREAGLRYQGDRGHESQRPCAAGAEYRQQRYVSAHRGERGRHRESPVDVLGCYLSHAWCTSVRCVFFRPIYIQHNQCACRCLLERRALRGHKLQGRGRHCNYQYYTAR